MKKLALLLSLALLAACGGGGSSSTPASTQGNSATPGNLQVNISDYAKSTAKTDIASDSMPLYRRVVLTNPALGSNYKLVAEGTVGTMSSPSFTNVPYANGYTIEIIDFRKPSSSTFAVYSSAGTAAVTFDPLEIQRATTTAPKLQPYIPYGYGKSALFNFTASGATVNITMAVTVTPTVTYPTSIPSSLTPGATYQVTATIPEDSPFNTAYWGVRQGSSLTLLGNAVDTYESAAGAGNLLTGPFIVTTGTKYYAEGLFFAKPSLLVAGEKYDRFVSSTGNFTANVTVQSGTINLSAPQP